MSGIGPNLPDLAAYRRELIAQGAPTTVPLVPTVKTGLLAQLPPPPAGRSGWPWTRETPPSLYDSAPDWPLISIVTPSYAQGQFLEETLRSVLLQNYPRLEYIVMDGGSKDASPAVIERYRPWLSFARIARDRGQSHAINQGFSLANGEVRGWVNSDDFYLPGALHAVAQAFRQKADFIYGDGLEADEGSPTVQLTPAKLALARYRKFPALVMQPSTFWSGVRHQPLWEEQHCALDYELWLRLLPAAHIGYVRGPLSYTRRHAAAKTSDPAMTRRWEEDAQRNGRAYPELYRSNRWLDREYRLVQRGIRSWRAREIERRGTELQAELGWQTPIVR